VTAEDVENEIRAIDRLCRPGGHPHIISILDHGWLSYDSYYFIDMELCDLSLHDYIYVSQAAPVSGNSVFVSKESDLLSTIQNIWIIQAQIADGLGFIHSQNLVHRDIKPRNSANP
jgi:serine/threonine protein kinase